MASAHIYQFGPMVALSVSDDESGLTVYLSDNQARQVARALYNIARANRTKKDHHSILIEDDQPKPAAPAVIRSASELKAAVLRAHPRTHFFDRDTLRFFGDTMANFSVRDAGENWELYRRRPVKHGLKSSHFFNKQTLEELITCLA